MRAPHSFASSVLLSLLIATSASAVTMAWKSVGNPGNPGQYGFGEGAVGYLYEIGTYEVTNGQYAEFLNAKAQDDPLGLYDPFMADPTFDSLNSEGAGGITRSGSSGSYVYTPIAGRENMPVNNVTFFDAIRFANWMNNGHGDGDTETGAYTLLGGTATPSNGDTVTRNPGATIFLPSQDEWFKAAYYDASSTGYNGFATGNSFPNCAPPTTAPNSANCGNAVGDVTNVGSYTGSPSPYGTFDQEGNVAEWNDTLDDTRRVIQAGSFADPPGQRGGGIYPGNSNALLGFRLAMIPEPSTGLLVIAGLLGLAGRRRARA